MRKKTFLICPVRGHDPQELDDIVKGLENSGYKVHYPPRDTNQVDNTGFMICSDNLNAIRQADVIHLVWDGISQGCLFDLGMAFALGKKLIIISVPELTTGKSFQNMANVWAGLED